MRNLKFLFLIVIIFFSQNVLAASLDVKIDKNTIPENKIFQASVYLNTEGETINTIEGDLNYDSTLLQVEFINIGSSFINFWLEKPENKTPGLIHFSGITPGGILTDRGEVFYVIFRTKKEGQVSLVLSGVTLLLNDGVGTMVKNKVENTSVQIVSNQNKKGDVNFVFEDKNSPEKFSVVRTHDVLLFDDKSFIVFSTTDKGSGIDHYEVCELFSCVNASSPYLLRNQTPFYYLKVKAYDLNGNVSVTSVTSPYLYLIFVFLGIILYFLYRYFKRVRV